MLNDDLLTHKFCKGLIVVASALMLSACAELKERGFDFWQTKYSEISVDENADILHEEIPQKWWHLYEDERLEKLVELSLARNPGLDQIRARLEQAAALSDRSFADLLPQLNVSGEAAKNYTNAADGKEFSFLGAASYELDLWGKNRAYWLSDETFAEAAKADVKAAAISLSASVVETWLRLLALREEEALLEQQIEINQTVMELQQKRYGQGVASALEVLQQAQLLAQAEAQLPDVKNAMALTKHQLAVLTGQPPKTPLDISSEKLPELAPLPQTGLTSEILAARPDVEAAWLRVTASDWGAEAARLERLPSFDLSAAYSTSDAAFDLLFHNWLLEMAAAISAPVFDGGFRSAEAARQAALADERFYAYKETVLEALRDVEDALSNNYFGAEKLAALQRQLDASEATLEQAHISYANGTTSYLDVLNGLLNVQTTQRQLIQTRRDLALQRVALYRSLGLASWTEDAIYKDETKSESDEDISE